MRVAIALSGIDAGQSGIGRYVRAVLPRLNERLSRMAGALAALGTAREFDACENELESADRIRLPDLCDRASASALWYLFLAGRWARRAGADVLLLPAANRRVTWVSEIPTVAVVHDLAQLHIRRKYDRLRMFYAKRVLTSAFRRATQLVATSEATREDLVSALGCAPNRVRVIYAGVDTKLFEPREAHSTQVTAAQRAAGLTRPYLIYPARLEHPSKNHVRLLNALARSALRRSHQLVIVGRDWGAKERIRAEIKHLGLEDSVRLLGYVSDQMLAALISGARAVLVLGLHEGFGLSALEGLAAGRPVVVSRTGAAHESVGFLGAVCDPYDEESIRRVLESVVTDMALHERVAAQGPAWAARWTWEATAKGLVEACVAAVTS